MFYLDTYCIVRLNISLISATDIFPNSIYLLGKSHLSRHSYMARFKRKRSMFQNMRSFIFSTVCFSSSYMVTKPFEGSPINIELNDGSPKVGLVSDRNRYTNLYAVVLLCNRVIPTDQVFWQLQPSLTQSFSQFNWQWA